MEVVVLLLLVLGISLQASDKPEGVYEPKLVKEESRPYLAINYSKNGYMISSESFVPTAKTSYSEAKNQKNKTASIPDYKRDTEVLSSKTSKKAEVETSKKAEVETNVKAEANTCNDVFEIGFKAGSYLLSQESIAIYQKMMAVSNSCTDKDLNIVSFLDKPTAGEINLAKERMSYIEIKAQQHSRHEIFIEKKILNASDDFKDKSDKVFVILVDKIK